MEKNKVLPGQLRMEDIAKETQGKKRYAVSPFELTEEEKTYIRAYFQYCVFAERRPSIAEVLETFDWTREDRLRWYPAWRDWSLDDQMCAGEFKYRTSAISRFFKVLNEENGSRFQFKD